MTMMTPQQSTPPSGSGPVLVQLSTVNPEPVSWLWPRRTARGKLNLRFGDPEAGKSFELLDEAARVTRGGVWPDGGDAPQGDVILLTAEDGLADTVRPRVDALGGDPTKVHVLRAVRKQGKERSFSLRADIDQLEKAIAQTQAIFVGIDPLTAYLDKTDTFKDSEVRSVLAPLAALAERYGVAVVGVMHLTKDAQRQIIHRASGSIAFIAAARAVFLVAKDPENKNRRFFVPVKLNIAAHPPTLAFTLDNGSLTWEPDPVDVDAQTLLGPPGLSEDPAERESAEEFLRERLKDGPVEAKEVLETAKKHGISERTLYRAKQRLAVTSGRVGGLAGSGVWAWYPPTEATNGDA